MDSEVWFRKGCGLDQCFPSVFGIGAKFPWQKSGSISPCLCGRNPTTLHFKCVHSTQILFSPSFCYKNTATEVPHFYGKNSIEFRVWWGRVSCLCIWYVQTYSCQDELEPLKASSILMRIAYIGKLISLRQHGSRQSHRDDHAHNISWICTYSNCHEHIPTLQGQEHSWLEMVAYLATRVHHTKCTIRRCHTQGTRPK